MSKFVDDVDDVERGKKFLADNYSTYRVQIDYDDDNTPHINLYSVRPDTTGGEIFSFVRELDGSALFEEVAEIFFTVSGQTTEGICEIDFGDEEEIFIGPAKKALQHYINHMTPKEAENHLRFLLELGKESERRQAEERK